MQNSVKLAGFITGFALISILLDLTILRQVLGWLFLSFVPGYLLFRLLKLEKADWLTAILYSSGLSVAILMFLGLFLNGILPLFGVSSPLSFGPLMISISALVLFLFLLSGKQRSEAVSTVPTGKMNLVLLVQLFLLSILPALSVFGALFHNIPVLMFALIGIAVLFAACIAAGKRIDNRVFPLAIASASIALLLHTVLITNHFMGSDVFLEFYTFRQTQIQGFWNAPGVVVSYTLIETLNSVLSITIMPTIFTNILNINGEFFFKLFYPFVFSLVPLVIYKMYANQTGRKIALITAFFFISTSTVFYGIEPLSLDRQIIGQFFFLLSFLLIAQNSLSMGKRTILLIFFVFSLIVSHYALAFIFVLYILLLFFLPRIRIISRLLNLRGPASILNWGLTLLIIAMTFSWYLYVSNSPFNQFSNSLNHIITFFVSDFSKVDARLTPSLMSLSPTTTTTLVGLVHKSLIYLQSLLIGVGALACIVKPKESKLDDASRIGALIGFSFLLLSLAIPNLATILNMTRIYAIVAPFLAPLYIYGFIFIAALGGTLVSKVTKARCTRIKNIGVYLAALVLIMIFLFQTGLVNHVTNDYPYSYSIDLERRENSNDLGIRADTHSLYFLTSEVRSANWLSDNSVSTLKTYADLNSRSTFLKGYATMTDEQMLLITNETTRWLNRQTYVYLKYLNVQLGLISVSIGTTSTYLNTFTMAPALAECDGIYSNGDANIYFNP